MVAGRSAIILGVVLAVQSVLAGVAETQSPPASTPIINSQSSIINPSPSADPNLPMLYVVGDSTASNGPDLGWGSHLGKYFDPAKVTVVNRARAGRSSRTFQTEGLWDAVLGQLKPGDYVLIQFGHNDGGAVNDASRARGSLPGLGDQMQEIDNQVTGKREVVHTYGWYMRRFIADTKAGGANPIVLSLTVRNIWRDGHVERGSGRFGPWAAEIAKSQGVPFIDLTNIIADQYELLGPIRVTDLFPRDHTHTSAEAANLNAALVVAGLKALPDCPLTAMLSPDGHKPPAAPATYVATNVRNVIASPSARLGAGYAKQSASEVSNQRSQILKSAGEAAIRNHVIASEARQPQSAMSDSSSDIKHQTSNFILPQAQLVLSAPWMPDVQPKMDPNLPTLFCIGDSTVRTGSRGDGANGQWGWGAPIAQFFDRARINVENRAMGGTSSRTFQSLGLWDKVLADMKPGDFVILQFGHNDAGPLNDTSRARGTIRGSGDESEEIDNQLTGKHETVHTYGWYIRKFITDARARGASAIVCSPIPRNNWSEGKVRRATDDYTRWASEAAAAENTPFIDLNDLIARQYEQMGQDKVTALCFPPPNEHTHTSAYGARLNATCVVEGIKALPDHPLQQYLKAARP